MTSPNYIFIPSAMKKLLRIHTKVRLNDDEVTQILLEHGLDNVEKAGRYIDIVALIRDVESAHGIE